MRMKKVFLAAVLGLGLAGIATAGSAQDARPEVLARGEYLLRVGGCNDCHTAGYGEKGGQVPTATWLTGVPVGYQGPWGTTYAANLRLTMTAITEEQWLQQARLPRLPPMPYWALKDMTDADLRAVYQFVRSLGAAGTKMPQTVAPGGPVTTPVIVMVPQASR